MATTLSEGGKRSVLIIEADLHRPAVTQRLGIDPAGASVAVGLGQCLKDGHNPLNCVVKINPLDFYLLPAGKSVEDPTELVQSEHWGEVMDQLTPHFDWILVDSPPLVPLTDAVSLSKKCDASILVVRAHQTPREMVKQSLALLGKKHVLGVLFNASETVNETYAKYGSYYGGN
jgi:capsular exopolysaccharide synthesis family protein